MKIIRGLVLGMLAGLGLTAHAQVYSQTIVGYINQAMYAGDNLIANQLSNSNNTLNAIFDGNPASGTGVPAGATFTEWDSTTQQYLPASTYDTVNGWSIDYTLGYGQGGLLNTPAAFTNTFIGTVWPGFSGASTNFLPPLVAGSGTQLLSCYIPIDDATFDDVVGRDPLNGESVTTLDPSTQIYTTTTFDDGVWNNGAPALDIGQSALFDLEDGADPRVPEPAAGALVGAGALGLALLRRRQRRV